MPILFKGYAVVSADGFIADDQGQMPDTLRFEADWAYFQAALDGADITLLGRYTHEAAPNAKGRRRLVVSRGVRAVVQEDSLTSWVNPRDMTPASAIAVAVGAEAKVAVAGGTDVFSWILEDAGYDEFHLSIAHKVKLGVGRPLLNDIRRLEDAMRAFEATGLRIKSRLWLDEQAGLELLTLEQSNKL